MSGDEPELENAASKRRLAARAAGDRSGRRPRSSPRSSASSSPRAAPSEDEAAELPPAPVSSTWNDDLVAPRQDGIHAYTAHGYRQTLVTRIDRDGQIVEDADDELATRRPRRPLRRHLRLAPGRSGARLRRPRLRTRAAGPASRSPTRRRSRRSKPSRPKPCPSSNAVLVRERAARRGLTGATSRAAARRRSGSSSR